MGETLDDVVGEFGLDFSGGASQHLGIMFWETIDSLAKRDLSDRADELRERLEGWGDEELAVFQREAGEVYVRVFSPAVYHLYCIAFEGETNGDGLTDFCENLMLSGRSLVEAVLKDPDAFADVPAGDAVAFNDDSGFSVGSIGWRILNQRHDDDVPQGLWERAGMSAPGNLWEELERQVGSIDFEPNWQRAEMGLRGVLAGKRGR